MTASQSRAAWSVTLAAAAILMVTMGVRQSQGLFISPINTSTGLGVVAISFAIAIGQFTWGAIQPIAGAVADKFGPAPVLAAGLVLLAAGMALTPFMSSGFGMVVSIGLLTAAGAGTGAFSVIMGAVGQQLAPERRGFSSGVINAGASVGQFVFAPLAQFLITAFGWMAALWSMAAVSLAALPLTRMLRGKPHATPIAGATVEKTLRGALREAAQDRSYLLLHAGFFTCGFHIAFLVTHLPGEVQLCGLPPHVASWSLAIIGMANIAGSIAVGWGVQKVRSKSILFWMYAARAAMIALYVAAPKSEWTFYLFSAGLGATWLATVPPTATLVGKLFGVRYLATLFGLTLLSHQIGGFFGAWLGGLAVSTQGHFQWMWVADMTLAAAAALTNLPIREAPVQRLHPA